MTTTKFTQFYQKISHATALETAVIYPDTDVAINGALLAAQENSIKPIFLGDKNKIQTAIIQHGEEPSKYLIFDLSPHDAIIQGIKMARDGAVKIIMKGSVHTDELMTEVVNSERGLRINKRMSHCMVIDIPTHKKLLILTDTALNICHNLQEKKAIVQNAIDFAQTLGIATPKVALLSASETINKKISSTLDYVALCEMAEQKQITGGIVNGPLSLDLAISPTSASLKKVTSKVAGEADILIVPNLECGNILVKALDYFANALSLGLILGAKIPIILTSRSACTHARAGSCMLAKLHYYHNAKL